MISQTGIVSGLVSLSLLLGAISSTAQMPHQTHPSAQPEESRLEQPLWLKGAVAVGGFGLIGLELWWFLFSKPKSRGAQQD
jgi:plastocyanin domain-containing protein